MRVVWLATLGTLGGLHAASWGAYKDSPFEGFRWRSYMRSIVLGLVAAIAVVATGRSRDYEPVVLIGLFYCLERLATEWWKTFLRKDDQSAYSIPMRLGYRGRPIDNPAIRYVLGSLSVIGLIALCWTVAALQRDLPAPAWWALIIVGGTGGWLTACGGAWKDAPIEGFSGWKFLRSPLVATLWAVPITLMSKDLVVATLSSGGFAVASIETYKTFLTGERPPGKFATKPVQFDVPSGRNLFAVVHAGIWTAMASLLVARIGGMLEAFSRLEVTPPSPPFALSLVAMASATAATFVVGSMVRVRWWSGAISNRPSTD